MIIEEDIAGVTRIVTVGMRKKTLDMWDNGDIYNGDMGSQRWKILLPYS